MLEVPNICAFNHARVRRRPEEEVGGHLVGPGLLHGGYGFPIVTRVKGKGRGGEEGKGRKGGWSS